MNTGTSKAIQNTGWPFYLLCGRIGMHLGSFCLAIAYRGNLDDGDYVPIPLATLADRLMGIADELGCAWGLEEFACGIEAIAERMQDRDVLNERMLALQERAAKSPNHAVSGRTLFKELRRDRRFQADMRLILKAEGTTYRGQKILGGNDPYIWRFTRKEIMAELKGELGNQLGVCNVPKTTPAASA